MEHNEREDPDRPLTPEEGGGPPVGSAWTLVVDGDDGWSADLEHAAPLPRSGERVELIAADGRRAWFRVVDVVHTLQPSASGRPLVREEDASPNAVVDRPSEGPPGVLRAGLPRVVVTPDSGG